MVTDKKQCEEEADPMASIAICKEPSVPFLNPTESGASERRQKN